MQQNNIKIQYKPEQTAQNWKTAKQILHETVVRGYTNVKQCNEKQIWEQKGDEHSTTEDKEKYIQLAKERSQPQKTISMHAKQLAKLGLLRRTQKASQSWKLATQYVKKEKENIIYPKQPITNIDKKNQERAL